ncbi:MAG TPA: MucB/RseB C-terminal domain-containing protein [Guyparkeria sp.]|nr:MucB/RseB C-terminal domain-containing protein [Guyparkeria sp.]
MRASRLPVLPLSILVTGALASVALLFASVVSAEPFLQALPAAPEAPSSLETSVSGERGGDNNEQELRERIMAMVQAMGNRNYDGRLIHVRGDQIDLMRVTHRKVDGQRVELMVSENGEVREIRRLGDRCACIWPERQQVMLGDYPNINSRLSGERFESIGELSDNYRLIDLGSSRVASQSCRLMAVVPRDDYRYGYKMCIGEPVPLLLRMSIYDESGRPIEHNQFTRLEQDEPVRLFFQDDLTAGLGEGFEWMELVGEPVEPAPIRQGHWGIDPLPDGFAIRSRGWRRNPVTGQYFEHIVVSDGLATASVFVEKRDDDDVARQVTRTDQGMTMAARRVDQVRITAIGDVPASTVELLVENTWPEPAMAPGEVELTDELRR